MKKLNKILTKEEIIEKLRVYVPQRRYAADIKSLSLFGSYARNEQTNDSDIDLLIELKNTSNISLLDLISIKYDIEDIFDLDVHLLTPKSLSKYFKEEILSQSINII